MLLLTSWVADKVDDAALTGKVKTALAAEPAVSALKIDVDTKDKVVTLSGNVDSQAAKDQAVALARGTEGVADVVDNITVAGGAAAMPGEHPTGEMGGTGATTGANPSANAADAAPAPGGEHDAAVGGNAPNPEPNRPVGTVMDDAAITAAVKAKDSAVTVTSVRMDPDGSYDVFGTKAGATVMLEVSKDLKTITTHTGGGPDGAARPA